MTRLPFLALAFLFAAATASAETITSHGLAEFGEPELPADFEHFPYADPNAPKGGTLRLAMWPAFETLNRIPLGGQNARNWTLSYDALMVTSQDELSSYYGLLAESVTYEADGSAITFTLRPEARFHDGAPVTAEDVLFTFESIREHGEPFLKAQFEAVIDATVNGSHEITFTYEPGTPRDEFTKVASLWASPKHWWTADGRDISKDLVEPPLGSGPYRVVDVDVGRAIKYERVEDYWGADLPVNRGLWNFDAIEYDYYLDRTILLEAFLGGDADFSISRSSRDWATRYAGPAVDAGAIIREEVPAISFRGKQGYFMNTRNPALANEQVREALQYLYPFEWVNKTVMYGLYERMVSYFTNGSDFAATGVPQGDELAVLEPFRDRLPEAIFAEEPGLPQNPEQQISRENRREALRLLAEGGYELSSQKLVNAQTGEQLSLQILLSSQVLEPHTAPFVDAMKQLGIDASIRVVDTAEFQRRYQTREFEIISFAYTFFPPPGAEMGNRFGSSAADVEGSANLIGIKDPVVDELIEVILAAETYEAKAAGTRALDRVLRAGNYVVPHWHSSTRWIAYWDMFGFPERQPPYEFAGANTIEFQPTWWFDPEKAERLEEFR
ncbi:MAG: extracellular solute-binding protein [Pseudomonadota bacterium]